MSFVDSRLYPPPGRLVSRYYSNLPNFQAPPPDLGRASGRRNHKGGGKGITFIISGALGICIGWILCLNVAIDLGSTTNISESRVKHGPTTEPKYEGQGWKNIPVFVGGEDLFEKNINPPKKVKKWYGEHEQDLAVTSLLSKKTNGFFVDLAANHPTFYSNTCIHWKEFLTGPVSALNRIPITGGGLPRQGTVS